MAKNDKVEEKDVKKKKTTKKQTETTKKAAGTKKSTVKENVKTTKKTVKDDKKVNGDKKANGDKKVKEVKEVKKVKEEKVVDEVSQNVETTPISEPKKRNYLGTILVIGCVLLILVAFVLSVIETREKNKYYKTVSFDEVVELMNDDEVSIVYFGSPNCGYCTMFSPIVKEVSYEYKLIFNYLNAANLTNDDYATLYTHLTNYNEAFATDELGTPSLILVKDGAIVDVSEGYLGEEDLIKYLQTKELISVNTYTEGN